MIPLSSTACRVLGSLLEKERTVPATYPLTLNALQAAANQTTGRDPVLALDEADVSGAIDELRQAGFVRLVHPSHGARMVKYRQVADEALGLDAPGRAVLTVLLLRGPQTTGELRSRSDRLHEFDSVDEVERALERLAGFEPPLVSRLARQPGQKEPRWAHHLAGTPSAPQSASTHASIDVVPPALSAVAAFVGRWSGDGNGVYPTIDPFAYTEQIELRPVPGKPILSYRSTTRAADDGRTLHGESGFMRVIPGDHDAVGTSSIEMVIAQGAGLVEIAEGLVEGGPMQGGELIVSSTQVVGTSTAKHVSATERRYRVDGDTLTYEIAMAAVDQPLQVHLRATLRRDAARD